ncbi:MAG: HAMP domain-containing histidine kinase [Planctomycetes bacterium]|nr:HAMP domain-containing histidine kinase [Planctomycetota bacterium]
MTIMAWQPSRTLVASLLTAAALGLPIAAWYITGRHDLIERTQRLTQEQPRRLARQKAVVLAERIATRLQALIENEVKRPFYYYNNLYHDPKGASEGPSVQLSPLAQGPSEPLIEAYFQIDPQNRVSLPTLNPVVPEGNVAMDLPRQRELLSVLEPAAASCVVALNGNPAGSPWTSAPYQTAEQSVAEPQQTASQQEAQGPEQVKQVQVESAAPQQPASSTSSAPQPSQEQQQAMPQQNAWNGNRYEQKIDNDAWVQILNSNSTYIDIQSRKNKRIGGKGDPGDAHTEPQTAMQGGEEVVIYESDFVWRTVPIESRARLVALRQVTTPLGALTQGILLSEAEVDRLLKLPDLASRGSAVMAASLQAGLSRLPHHAPLPIDGAHWHVAVDPAPALAAGEQYASELESEFLWTFWSGALIAVLAGCCVVLLVSQSEQLARQRAQFAASAAHELRTPLAGMRMYGEMLAEGLGDPAKTRDYARRVADEAERLGRVVGNVLNFSRLERGVLEVAAEPGDLVAAVQASVERMRPALEHLGATVEVQSNAATRIARFDPEALHQILQNLIDNAEKYSRTSSDRSIGIKITPDAHGGLELAVADRGPGIDKALRKRLFQPFSRGCGADAPAGLGLGLALTQALVHAQGAGISYREAPGGGACFAVRFPAVK